MKSFQELEAMMISRLDQELNPMLKYHSVRHTRDVLKATKRIAKSEGITHEDHRLLMTAALFHDAGFLIGYEDHEMNGCTLVQRILPEYGFCESSVATICGLIMATKVPQEPVGLLQEIICDADLDYLGRDDFFDIGEDLFKEFLDRGIVKNACDWDQLQVSFMEKHQYFTKTNQKARQGMKVENLKVVRERLENCRTGA